MSVGKIQDLTQSRRFGKGCPGKRGGTRGLKEECALDGWGRHSWTRMVGECLKVGGIVVFSRERKRVMDGALRMRWVVEQNEAGMQDPLMHLGLHAQSHGKPWKNIIDWSTGLVNDHI